MTKKIIEISDEDYEQKMKEIRAIPADKWKPTSVVELAELRIAIEQNRIENMKEELTQLRKMSTV